VEAQALYQQIILDHAKAPHGSGLREPFGVQVHHVNPTCGDEITLRARVVGGVDGTVEDVSYESLGCSISTAGASVMAETVTGLPVAEAMRRYDLVLEMLQSRGTVAGDPELLGDAVALAGVSRYPARVKCALLGWAAMRDAVLTATSKEPA
jgi:nitrogen fixation NifU-like protein